MTGGLLPLIGMLLIAILVILAIVQGINGVVLASGMALIGGLAGYTARRWQDTRHKT